MHLCRGVAALITQYVVGPHPLITTHFPSFSTVVTSQPFTEYKGQRHCTGVQSTLYDCCMSRLTHRVECNRRLFSSDRITPLYCQYTTATSTLCTHPLRASKSRLRVQPLVEGKAGTSAINDYGSSVERERDLLHWVRHRRRGCCTVHAL